MLHKSLQLDVIGKFDTECKKRRPKGRYLRDKFSHNSSLPKNEISIAKDTKQVFSQLQFHQRRCSIAQLSRPAKGSEPARRPRLPQSPLRSPSPTVEIRLIDEEPQAQPERRVRLQRWLLSHLDPHPTVDLLELSVPGKIPM